MRIVVVSDSHKDFYSLQKAVLSQSSAEVVVFCGDGNEDMDTLAVTIPDKMIISVRGNCDWCSEKRYSEEITLENKHIFVTHGHLFGVKSGYRDRMSVIQATPVSRTEQKSQQIRILTDGSIY